MAAPAVSIETLADTLTKLLAPYATHSVTQMQTQRVMKYSPRYRLAFTLLNEDSSSGTAALSWDVQEAIQGTLRTAFYDYPDGLTLAMIHSPCRSTAREAFRFAQFHN